MKKITIIMATYNVEDCLERAVESIRSQTMPQEELAIILADDCSTDGTYALGEALTRRYENIRLLRTPGNSGSCGTPRNLALEGVETPYVMYLDPDDTFYPRACQILYETAEAEGADLVKGACLINGREEILAGKKTLLTDPQEILELPLVNTCAQLWRTDIIREGQIRFTDGIIYEDNEYYYKYLKACRKVAVIPDLVHAYETRDSGPELSATRKHSARTLIHLATAHSKVRALFQGREEAFRPVAARLFREFLWKLTVTPELTEEEEAQLARLLAWVPEVLPEEDLSQALIRKKQINLLAAYFKERMGLFPGGEEELHEKILRNPQVSLKRLLILKARSLLKRGRQA